METNKLKSKMSGFSFEVSVTSFQDLKNMASYLAHQRHDEEIGKPTEIKFEGKIITALKYINIIPYGDEIEKIDYILGYQNNEFDFTLKDKYRFHVKFYINHENPLECGRGEIKSYLFTRIVFDYQDPEAKEELIRSCWSWWRKHTNLDKKERKVTIYMNTERGYFNRITDKPNRSLDTIYLPSKDKNCVRDMIANFIKPETRDLYARLGKNYKLVIMLHGIPGSGKTSFIHALASEFSFNINIYFNNKKNEDTDIPALLQEVGKGSFLVFEDADSLFNTREDSSKSGVTFSAVLNIFDGLASPINSVNPLIIFVTTNCLDRLDKTFIRPGRVDHFLEFKEMRKQEIKDMMSNFCQESYTDELGEAFCRELKSKRYKVTPALLELHFFKYMNNPEKIISEIEEIGSLKKIVESDEKDLYT